MGATARVRFHTLGVVALETPESGDGSVVLRGPKRLALLVLLALSTPRGFQRRDTIVGLLWPELDQPRARHALRNALHHVRQGVGAGIVENRGSEEVGVDLRRFWCDVAALQEAVHEGRFGLALELYRGELLQGFHLPEAPGFERWLEERRRTVRRLVQEAAWSDAMRRERAGDPEGAVGRARQAVALDPVDEGAVRRLIVLLDRLGRRIEALRAYEDLAARLRTELELEPSEDTHRLASAVRSGRSAHLPGASPSPLLALSSGT